MEKLLSSEFWDKLLSASYNWIITEIPGIIILIIALVIMLRISQYAIKRFKKTLLYRAEHDDKVDTAEVEKRVNTLSAIIMGAIKITLFTMVIIMLLSKFRINIGPILASAGILGLALGFGAQELVRDYISGFFILLEDQVRTGDVAIINGTGGLVEKIELRTITLRDLSGVVHIFQNGKISSLSNMTKDWSAMVFDIGVAYKEDIDKVLKIMKEVGENLKSDPAFNQIIIDPIEISGLNEFGNSALVMRARIKTKPGQQWGTGREYRRRLKMAFDENNIEIPFPHTTVYWGEEINPLKLEVDKNEQPPKQA